MLSAVVRRSLYALAALIAVVLAGPMLPLELAVWFSGELLLYLEVVAGILLTSRAAQLRTRLKAISRHAAYTGARIWYHVAYSTSPVTKWCHAALSIQ
jgi:hypothetical protein